MSSLQFSNKVQTVIARESYSAIRLMSTLHSKELEKLAISLAIKCGILENGNRLHQDGTD